MLRAFAFDRVAVLVGDLYFLDPQPSPGQEGAEHGVRLELRVAVRGELKASIYSAQPIEVAEPIWRVDLLESVAGPVGSYNRTHHHPVFKGWDPSSRVFDRELSKDPFGWLASQLADPEAIIARAGFPADTASQADVDGVRDSAPEIVAAARDLLERVRSGELGQPPADSDADSIRNGWL